MINNLEIEYKCLVNREQFEKLSNLYPNKTFIRQKNTYYDTKTNDLQQKKCALRIREKEGTFLVTLKTPAENGHHEYEYYVTENSPTMFSKGEIVSILHELNIYDEMIAIAECVTYRAVVETELAELCFDINEYNGFVDYEIEYEQKVDHDGKKEFNKILSKINLNFTKNCASKIKRTFNTK